MKIFLYGTLKKDCSNHNRIEATEFISKAITKEKYCMYPNADYSFPYLVEDSDLGQIQGEIYEVDNLTIRMLDFFEGVPNHFYRKSITCILEDNREIECFVYFKAKNTADKCRRGEGMLFWNNSIMQSKHNQYKMY